MGGHHSRDRSKSKCFECLKSCLGGGRCLVFYNEVVLSYEALHGLGRSTNHEVVEASDLVIKISGIIQSVYCRVARSSTYRKCLVGQIATGLMFLEKLKSFHPIA